MTNYIDGQDPPKATLTEKNKAKARAKRITHNFERYFNINADGWAELVSEAHDWLEKYHSADSEGLDSAPLRLRRGARNLIEMTKDLPSIMPAQALRVIYIYWLITHVDTSDYQIGPEQDWSVGTLSHEQVFYGYIESKSIIGDYKTENITSDIELWESLCEQALKAVMPKPKTRKYNKTGRRNVSESSRNLILQYLDDNPDLDTRDKQLEAIKKKFPDVRCSNRKTLIDWENQVRDEKARQVLNELEAAEAQSQSKSNNSHDREVTSIFS